jgi:hypothetical protein
MILQSYGTDKQDFIIDDEDFEKVSKHKWRLLGGTNGKKYLMVTVGDSILVLARYLMNPPDDMQVDHMNANTLDNRKSNLLICTPSLNTQRTPTKYVKDYGSNKVSIYKGARWHKGKWYSEIKSRGKKYHLGVFDDIILAATAYNKAAYQLFGPNAYFNKVCCVLLYYTWDETEMSNFDIYT